MGAEECLSDRHPALSCNEKVIPSGSLQGARSLAGGDQFLIFLGRLWSFGVWARDDRQLELRDCESL